MRRTLQVGFAEEVCAFLNGHLVYSGRNTYSPIQTRLSPDGRLEPDDALVPLDLRKGLNEIVLAVGNGWPSGKARWSLHYGWIAEAHFDQTEGLNLP